MCKLYFRYGVMGSAKSMDLMVHAYNHEERGLRVLVLKPTIDTRSLEIKSRIGMTMECIPVQPDDTISDAISRNLGHRRTTTTMSGVAEWIYVDEAQFLTPEQVDELCDIVDNGVNVVCYGLRTDFKGETFPGSKRLLEMSDTIEELKSSCSCGNKAIINARIVDGQVVDSGEQVLIGGNEQYVPMCRACWNKKRYRSIRGEATLF